MLNWGISRNCAVIPKATSLEHLLENTQFLDFSLSEDEVKKITEKMNINRRLCNFFDPEEFDCFA